MFAASWRVLGKEYATFWGIAFLLNFFWESWHAVFLYNGFEAGGVQAATLQEFVPFMTRVSLTDAIILTLILLGGCVVWKRWDWYRVMSRNKYMYFLGVALLWAAAIEYKAIFLFQHWSYSERMPTVWGLGLSPLLQLGITGICALGLVRFVARQPKT